MPIRMDHVKGRIDIFFREGLIPKQLHNGKKEERILATLDCIFGYVPSEFCPTPISRIARTGRLLNIVVADEGVSYFGEIEFPVNGNAKKPIESYIHRATIKFIPPRDSQYSVIAKSLRGILIAEGQGDLAVSLELNENGSLITYSPLTTLS